MEHTATAQTGLLGWWNRTPLYLRIVGGMVLGVVVGLLLREHAAPLAVPSRLVLRVLGALAPMLILLAIIQALMKARFEKRLIYLLLLNTLVAICIGLVIANLVRPGHWAHPEQHAKPPEAGGGMLQQFLESIPQSLVGPLGDKGNIMSVIIIALAFGVALRTAATRPIQNVSDLVALGLETLIKMVHWVVTLVPHGVGRRAGIPEAGLSRETATEEVPPKAELETA